ncbi:hypothetical protein SUGI_0182710 [Cryptomeria japonica]|nr:hypothetical protein SUGI_0182710 [Cryptomeria japonica]
MMGFVSMGKPNKPKKKGRFLRSILRGFAAPIACRWRSMPRGPSHFPTIKSTVTGTLFGYRKGHVHFAVQEDPRCLPVLLIELATPTNSVVKEMASGLVRMALECERRPNRGSIFEESIWTLYCNGRKTGYAMRRSCCESDLRILNMVQAVSMGAGVLPTEEEGRDGELMYMRARFERVMGSRDCEAFYMMNPDGAGEPELSIFLLRV